MTIDSRITTNRFILISGIWIFTIGLIRFIHRPYGLDFDGAEQTYLAQWFELGSGIQPPLPTWIFHFVFEVFGHSVALVHAVRLFFIFLIYIGFYRLSLKLLKSSPLALICTLSLVFIFQFSSVMLKQMHTVFITLAVIYSWLSILNIHEKGKLKSYIWLGFWVGIGLLSKYTFLVHIVAILIATISIQEIKKGLLNPRILASIIVALLISCPHYSWLIENLNVISSGISNDLTTEAEPNRLTDLSKGLVALLLKSLAFGGILILVFAGFFFSTFRSNLKRKESPFFRLLGRYLLISFLALILIIIATRATIFHEHWLQPFFIIIPIILFQKLKGSETSLIKKIKVLKYICLVLFFCISIDFAFKSYVKIYTGHKRSVFNIPYKDMADLIESFAPQSNLVFTQDAITAGHLKMLLPDKLVLVDNDLDHMTMESARILSASQPVFIWKSTANQKIVPINLRYFQNAVHQDISINVIETKLENYDYVLTENTPFPVGITKISIAN